jgi:hypothetical protein
VQAQCDIGWSQPLAQGKLPDADLCLVLVLVSQEVLLPVLVSQDHRHQASSRAQAAATKAQPANDQSRCWC